MTHRFTSMLLLAILSSVATVSDAQDWAGKLFPVQTHDFGTVVRGAETEFRFEFQNKYVEDVRISGVRASCGCTTPSVTKSTLKTWEKSAVVARFNTDRFTGHKSATITVTFDKPFFAEVQLNVAGYIRTDVVISPGVVNFGEVDQSSSSEQKVVVRHAGRADWRITDVRSANPNFQVALQPPVRNGINTDYAMVVQLKPGAPIGYFKDELAIVTNDPSNQRLTLAVEGRVNSLLAVIPSSLPLGNLEVGQTVTKKMVVRSKKPFKVLSVNCGSDCFDVNFTADKAALHHVVELTFRADQAGELTQPISIVTDLGTTGGVATALVK